MLLVHKDLNIIRPQIFHRHKKRTLFIKLLETAHYAI